MTCRIWEQAQSHLLCEPTALAAGIATPIEPRKTRC